ncbi:MAG: CHAT domain-containing protein [Cyanobacteria bacterium J055]|nr:MAG: CHAT domain-containing protein [Cyanobacteria bacterium J055]
MTQEFHISIVPIGETNRYRVRTERVGPDVPLAEESIDLPLESWLTQARYLMKDPVVGVLDTPSLQESDRWQEWQSPTLDLASLGRELYDTVFRGSVRDAWIAAQAIAQHRREALRLRLALSGSRLSSLPWEVLHDGHRPLATRTEIVFSRYQPTDKRLSVPDLPGSPAQQPQLLRILMAIAAPSDRQSLKLHQEAEELQRELHGRSEAEGLWDIDLTVLEHPDRARLAQALEQGRYQVFHYAGHSHSGPDGGAIDLVNQQHGLTEVLTGNELAGLLANNGIQIAVFNSCRGAYAGESEKLGEPGGERNLAEASIEQGIPAVLAMAERIPDEVALRLTQLFYRNLKLGNAVDLSLSRARQGLMVTYGSKQLYWALPILYLHSKFAGYPIGRPIDRPASVPANGNAIGSRMPRFGTSAPMLFDEEEVEGLLDEIEYPDTLDDDDAAFDREVRQTLDTLGSFPPPEPSPVRETPSTPLVANPPPPNPPQSPESKPIESPKPNLLQTPRRRRWKPLSKEWLLPGSLVAVAAISLGVLFYRIAFSPAEPEVFPPVTDVRPQPFDPDRLPEMETSEVTAIAIERFSRQEIEAGTLAVEALLDRGALQQAKAALEAVSQRDETHPDIEFLQGRLAWQFAQTDNPDYRTSTDDARRYWENAHKKMPDSWRYREALGFAYYEENKLDLAYQTWQQALPLVGTEADSANIRAGLALVLMKKSVQTRSPANAQKFQQDAIAQRQNVLTTAPVSFSSANALSPNWLWTETAIRDWQTLLQLQP